MPRDRDRNNNHDLINDLVELADQTISTVKDNVDESLKKSGYDNMGELLSDGIDRAFGKRKPEKPYSTHSHNVITTRFDYMKQVMSNIQYGRRYRGYYRDGYENVITTYLQELETYKDDLEFFESSIRHELSKVAKNVRNSRNKYREGQKDALEYILSELHYSQSQIMRKIQRELVKK